MKNLLLGVVLLLGTQSFAQYDPEAKTVLDAMSARYKKLDAFTATFSQALVNETAGIEEQLTGEVTVKGSMYKLDIAGQLVYNDGQDVWSYNEEIAEVTVSEYIPDDQEISLNNVWDLYKDGYKYILLSQDKNGVRTIDLDPVDRTKSFFKVRMMIDNENKLQSFMVFETNGNRFTYNILSLTEEKNITDSFFKFDPTKYPGVEVIDFR